ncbi:MAG: type IV secretory system conjugative DNA transfer family protein, partial [Clostridia bacterium]|nr:type IV secretory system conjugative DNA transfer family protein [Clostridia bacterium]
QLTGRELMTPDEVRLLDNRNALLFIRGERPVLDEKYDIQSHPNIRLSLDGGAQPYLHGRDTRSYATIVFDDDVADAAALSGMILTSYELLSEEELEEYFENKEKENEK